MLHHQALKKAVAEDKNILAAMQRLSKAEQLHLVPSISKTLSRDASKASDKSKSKGIDSCCIQMTSVVCSMEVGIAF